MLRKHITETRRKLKSLGFTARQFGVRTVHRDDGFAYALVSFYGTKAVEEAVSKAQAIADLGLDIFIYELANGYQHPLVTSLPNEARKVERRKWGESPL